MAEKFEGLGADYWEENYSSPEEMDGIFNAVNHARYAKNFFLIESVEVNSIIDFGFGLGHMFPSKIVCEMFAICLLNF